MGALCDIHVGGVMGQHSCRGCNGRERNGNKPGYQLKLMIQTGESDQKPQIWAILGPFVPNYGYDLF